MDDRMATAPDLMLARAREEAAIKTGIMKRLYNIGDGGRWDVDLDAGQIRFSGDDRLATAPVQVIGTYNIKDGTFLWGWDHPSVPPHAAEAAKALKAWGERHGVAGITTRKVAISEEQAWDFTSMAMHLTNGQGLYRGPSGTTLVFMTFGEVTLSKP